MHKNKRPNAQKQREEEQAIGAIYKQYIDTFQENAEIQMKTFIKSDILYAENAEKSNKGQLYTPKPLIKYRKKAEVLSQQISMGNPFAKKRDKSKSNLKALGDELKMLQHERQHKELGAKTGVDSLTMTPTSSSYPDYAISTNLFVSNLQPQVTEAHLIALFGAYGPLASVKIMWPRGGDGSRTGDGSKTATTFNCGFVAFMSRSDAERAMASLKDRNEMRINWGKAVKIPQHPVYIPPQLTKLYSPPPKSGLPFNAQVISGESEELDDLSTTVVKVTIPLNRAQLMLIHRMVEFVIREGSEFEALMITKEQNNTDFDFLTDYESADHTYYRWKLYSLLNGEHKNSWSAKPFRMYEGGSIWIPPVAPNYTQGMPKELIQGATDESKMTEAQVKRLVFLIRKLTLSRSSVAKTMLFCMNHAVAIDDVIEILTESLLNGATCPVKKLARLYVLSDVVYNCKIKKVAVAKFAQKCSLIFKEFHSTYAGLGQSTDREIFQVRVLRVLRFWLRHRFLDSNLVTKLENVLLSGNETGDDDNSSLNDEPLDGANLLKRSVLTTTTDCLIVKRKQIEDMFNPDL